MSTFITSFLTALLGAFFIIRYCNLHQTPFLDDDFTKVQRVHQIPVPRVGGAAILIGLLAGACINSLLQSPKADFIWTLIFLAFPSFLIGFIEDTYKNISARIRLSVIAISGLLFIYFDGAVISDLGIWGDHFFLSHYWIAAFITIFAICGLTNAYNIIDGLNGLSSMVGVISLLAIAYVSFLVGDIQIPGAALAMVGAIVGFFLWNYPRGLIFLGDGGSYLIGCWVAFLSILLVARYPLVSPWFAIMVNAYPVFETLFSMYRKKVHRGMSPGEPDGAHFHMLMYRRIVRWAGVGPGGVNSQSFISNSKTSPYLWLLSSAAVIPAVLFWKSTWALQIAFVLFCVSYILLYRSLVQFRAQKWLRFARKN
jgi:UDP-GlcNAc:undecaprenyl-phosphate GlcNAc-1-phosphate transferase